MSDSAAAAPPQSAGPWRLAALDPAGALALVVGGQGGVGAALAAGLAQRHPQATVRLSARQPAAADVLALDLQDEATIEAAAQRLAQDLAARQQSLRTLVLASGFLHHAGAGPERSWRQLDPAYLQQAFAVNAIGPALVIKHFFPLLARSGPVLAAFLSARVGSIGDNALGGWYGYRASKAALNQLVRTSAIELKRHNRDAVCVALHPGTVDTALSQPFAKTGLRVRPPEQAAAEMLDALAAFGPTHSGQFFAYDGSNVPW
ncbi:SDR family NAD(P)-dependent oxidoreductase [Curvibacter sp. HBC28]|uniref:SDR family NAD(P)-dependent oxidoreductase n=1 Tax=Curvibacter microcysteis TaxID=3026419 RepID=A0ABT5MAE8_9BURK|nr:SDR family NAD(P)-dependent oxidoreductase [Curvibacter sp. HBC28]MDD0813538.1 SDR family NAD(P)-dependent oxidoreductase [Curvibacter sp. HBC28]